jgi:hypothetical protein
MTSIAPVAPPRRVTVGVDTHKHVHVAVALDHLGGRPDDIMVSVDTGGCPTSRVGLEVWQGGDLRNRRARPTLQV